MKKISSVILSLIIIFSTLPLNAQNGVAPVVSRADLDHLDEVNITINKEFNRIDFDNPEARHKEFLDILKWKSDTAFKELKNTGTYSDKQTALNMARFPFIDKEECYLNEKDEKWKTQTPKCKTKGKNAFKSKYFQEPYQLYLYALEVYYVNIMEPAAQRIGLKDYRDMARRHIRQMIGKRSQDSNFFKDTEVEDKKNPMNEASYLVAYATQINSFYNTVREAKLTESKCKDPNLTDFWGYSKEECALINSLAKDYDLKVIQGGGQRIGTFASIAADEVEKCLRDVLFQLQTPLMPFEEVEDFLKNKSDLSYVDSDGNVHTPPESTWQSCGMSKKELIQIIADNSMTREEAKKSLKKSFGKKILQGLDYISFSYWQERIDKVNNFQDYVRTHFGEDKLEELVDEGREREEREIAERMAESYNAVLSAIATDLIAYGKIYYYHNDVNLVGLNEDNVPVDASSKFARTWYKMGTDRTQEDSPIAKFARGAILQAGGKARTLQDNLFTKTMYEVRIKDNVKTNVMIIGMYTDFIADPLVLLAPLGLVKDAIIARRALKAADTVGDIARNTNKAINAADAIGDATRTANKLDPITDLRPRSVSQVTNPVSNIPHAPNKPVVPTNSVTPAYNVGDALTDVSKGMDATEDLAKVPGSTPTTALSPTDLTPKLEGPFNDAVAKAGNTEPRTVVSGFGGGGNTHVTPTNTTSGAPEGMRRQIGFGNDGKYIPDEVGKAGNGNGGVQDLTKGKQGRGPRGTEGPRANNPYDVRNSAGGLDNPNTPAQDLSGVNRQISNNPTTTLERNEGRNLHRERQQNFAKVEDKTLNDALQGRGITDKTELYNGRKRLRAEVQKWVIYDGKFAGAVKVETKGSKVVVYKADGSKVVEQIEDFKFWFDGIPDMNVGISDKEKKAIAGLADVLGGVPSPTQTKPIGFVQKAADELADPIKQSAKAETPAVSQGLAPVLKKNGRLVDDIAGRVNGLKNSLTRGCSDANSCKNLIKYLQESVDPIKSKLSELQRAFAQATGNTDVEAFYKYLANDSETPKYIKDFLNNTELRNFVLNNGTVPGFNKIIGEMLPRYGWEDLAKILKSDIPKDLRPLQQMASPDDWKNVAAKARELLGKRKTFFLNKYDDLLYTAERSAPELVEKLRNGATPHITTLKKAGVDSKTANEIVDYYRQIEKINKALGDTPGTIAKAGNIDNVIKSEQHLLQNVTKVEKQAPTVYKVSDGAGFEGYVKVTDPSEVERTKMVQQLIDDPTTGLRSKYSNLDIEYPHVISEDTSSLPSSVRKDLSSNIQKASTSNSSRAKILQDPNSKTFIMSSVDTGGINYVDLKMSKMETSFPELQATIMKQLNNQPITKAEWNDIANLIQDLNKSNFQHGDLGPNLFIKRNPKTGKIKVTLIDFEVPPGGKYATDQHILDSFQSLLTQCGALVP